MSREVYNEKLAQVKGTTEFLGAMGLQIKEGENISTNKRKAQTCTPGGKRTNYRMLTWFTEGFAMLLTYFYVNIT